MIFILTPGANRDWTEKGKKEQKYSSNVRGGIPGGKEIDVERYERALENAGTTHEEARKYWNDISNYDIYSRTGKQLNDAVNSLAPTVSIANNKIDISAPDSVIESPLVDQIKEQLQTLKGIDLGSQEAANAINVLNEEIRKNLNDYMIQDTFGWTPEEFADYQRAIQAVNVTNPMNSKELFKAKRPGGGGDFYRYPEGHEKAGQIMELTPKQWIDQWREIFPTDQRTEMFLKSLESDDPYERMMALFMSGGRENPTYGFDTWERIKQGVGQFGENFVAKLLRPVVKNLSGGGDGKRVEALAAELNIKPEHIVYAGYNEDNDDAQKEYYQQSKNSIRGKSWDELTDNERGFLLEVAVSREIGALAEWERRGLSTPENEDIKNMSSGDAELSRQTIEKILDDSRFERYKEVDNRYANRLMIDLEEEETLEQMAKNATWSQAEQTIGAFTGTLSRYMLEAMLFKKLSGVDVTKISDKIGAKIMDFAMNRGVSFSSKGGEAFAKFMANLIGTVPEDIVQTTIDAVLTDDIDELKDALTGEGMTENLKNNLIFMALFNGARAGWSAIKTARIMKKLSKAADLNKTVDIGLMGSDATDIAKTYDNGGHVEVDGNTVYKIDSDGTREKMNNTTPEQARIIISIAENAVAGEGQAIAKAFENMDVANIIANGGTIAVDGGRVYAVDIDGNITELKRLTVGDANLLSKAMERRDAARILASGGSIEVRNGKVYGVDANGSSTELKDFTVEDAAILNKAMTQRNAAKIIADGGSVEIRDGKVYIIGADGNSVEADNLTVGDAQALNKMASNREALNALVNGGSVLVENGKIYVVDSNGRKIEISGMSVQDGQALNKIMTNREAANILADGGYIEVRNGGVYAVSQDGGSVVAFDGLTVEDASRLNSAMTKKEVADILANGGHAEVRNGRVYAVDQDGRAVEIEDFTVEEARQLNDAVSKTGKMQDPSTTGKIYAPDFDDAARAAIEASSVVDDAGKAANGSDTVKVEVETSDGVREVETPDYKINSLDDIVDSKVKIDASPASVKLWHSRALNKLMGMFSDTMSELKQRFGDVQASDFDWVWYNSKKGLSPDKIVGTTDPTTGRIVTQNMIDAMKWWGDQPIVKKLRMASRNAVGEAGDYNVLGYLPHTSYDPSILPFEETTTGMLWQHASGKSVLKDGNYVGYGGTLNGRYRTFASNMLWDIRNKEVQAGKLIEDAALDGKKLSPDEAMRMVDGWGEVQDRVTNPKKSKAMDGLEKGALADGDNGAADFEAAAKAMEEEAPNSGITKSMNKNFSEMYIGSGRGRVEQPKGAGKVTFSLGTIGDTMREIKVNGVSMYDAGAADMIYSPQNASEFVNRWEMNGSNPSDFRPALAEYLKVHSRRSAQYIEPVVDRIMARIAKENPGELTKGGLMKTLTKAFRSEATNRLRRWTVLADFDQFDESTVKFMDNFWYRHMQLEALANNRNIISKVADSLAELRYDALFYGNLKNALLQVSELNRLFTVFKWGDVGTMLRKIATDADFREKVDMYIDAVAPRTRYVEAGLYEKYGNMSDSIEVGETETKFGKFKDARGTVDRVALAPVEAAEALKNRTMVAALVAEADRLEAAGKIKGSDEKLMYIRRRFERVALAQNEMGKIGLSTNPFAKPFLFLQNFQIRELGMNYYNLVDPDDLLTGTKMKKGKWLNAAKYLTKLFGAKFATTLILSRLGYSAAQTMGLDPLGLAGGYDRLSDDEKTWIDEQISGGILTPLFAGGMTSILADMYFMARDAYEEANRVTMEDEAGAAFDKSQNPLDRMDWSAIFNLDTLRNQVANFAPGSTFANRIGQMNEMLDTGWATSSTGNKMYTAPDDPLNIGLGYLFGRSATQNAQNYRQTYGNDLGQTFGRILRGATGGGATFDPIDTKNYTDWFDGSDNDLQQFEKGKRWFIDERDRILDEYQDALQKGSKYGDVYESEAKASMNRRLDELFEKLSRFVKAYENQHGTISGKMVKELVGVLNIERESVNATQEEADESGLEEYSKAKERYAQLGLPTVGYYSGPSEDYPGTSTDESKADVKYKGSPQWQISSTSRYGLASEAAAVLAAGDAMLKDIRNELKDLYSNAVQSGDYTEFNKAQYDYLKAFDKVVAPIVATYGSGVLNNKEVKSQLEEMLTTSSSSGKTVGNLIPFDQYGLDKYGRRRSMPNESVNVVKWALERYSDDIFKRPTIRSYSTAQEDLDAIKRMINNGQNDLARARALSLKVRIDNQKRSLSKADYQWLLDFLNNGGK